MAQISKTLKKDLIIVKFGGSCLCNGLGIREAERIVKYLKDNDFEVIVVVSALQGVTDSLIQISEEVGYDQIDKRRQDEIISMGEHTSAILFKNILQMNNIKSEVLSPDQDTFPIITDDLFGNANPLINETRDKTRSMLLPLLKKGIVPILCGFTGRTRDGYVTTLGRGGSDTTAVLVGNCLEAKEIILVKDVNGIFSADPKKVDNPSFIDEIDIDELGILVSAGMEVVCYKALHFKPSEVNIRVVGLIVDNILENGTMIKG